MVAQLDFDPSGYTVSYQEERISLLAKEYALLQFLYSHRGQAFSREQLLDRVWPMEYPVERTVDDHIYRLRKKLRPWSNRVFLNTVRGYGYSLTVKEPDLRNPSMQDTELQAQMRQLMNKYLMYGQCKSMITLASQQDLLGFELPPSHLIFIRYAQADIHWFLTDTEFPLSSKLYYLLHFYLYFYNEPGKCLDYFERTMAANIGPEDHQRELRILNIIGLYTDNGRAEEDLSRVKAAYEAVREAGGDLDIFNVHIKMAEMYVHLGADNLSEAERCAGEVERMLEETPYLREICFYHGLKGRMLLRQGKRAEAAAALNYGIEVGEMTHNVPLIVGSIRETLVYLERSVQDPQLHRQFAAKYAEYNRMYQLEANKAPIEEKIESILNAV